jgi:hypothetical protein
MNAHRYQQLTRLWTALVVVAGGSRESLRILAAIKDEYEAVEQHAYLIGFRDGVNAGLDASLTAVPTMDTPPPDNGNQDCLETLTGREPQPGEIRDARTRLLREKLLELDAALDEGTATFQ